METLEHTTDVQFKKDVLDSPVPVLVDFWAEWCGPCRMMNPALEELAREYGGKARVVKLNADENQETASKFNVKGIPTFLFFKGGEVVRQVVGAVPKSTLDAGLREMLS